MRYSRSSAIVTTGRYEFWSSNAIWNRIGVETEAASEIGDVRWGIGVGLIAYGEGRDALSLMLAFYKSKRVLSICHEPSP
jgi:hypothetical protein